MESEDIPKNKRSICIHCCGPVGQSTEQSKDNNNSRFQHSSPSLSNSNYYVIKALSSIFKLNYLKPFDTFEWPQEDEEEDEKLTLLCGGCSDILTDLYHLYQDFLHLGQIDSFLSQKLGRLDEIIDCHQRKSIKCELITIDRSDHSPPEKKEIRHSSPEANRHHFPKKLKILLTKLPERELTTTTTTTKITTTTTPEVEEEEEEFNYDSPCSVGNDDDDDEDYNPNWLDVKIEEGDDELLVPDSEVKALEDIIESDDDDEKPLHPVEKISQQNSRPNRRNQNLSNFSKNETCYAEISESSSSSSSATVSKNFSTNQSKRKKTTNKGSHHSKDHLNEKNAPKYLALKAKFPNPCWYCQRTDFETPTELFEHTMEEHFPKNDKKNEEKLSSLQVCKRCSKIFTGSKYFDLHLQRCQSVPPGVVHKPFQCTVCLKGFSRKDSLRSHLAIHSDDRPFSCDQCIFTTKSSRSLRMHKLNMHRNSNERYKCDECDRDFKSQQVLRSHKSTMHTTRGYKRYKEYWKIFLARQREKPKARAKPKSTLCVDCDVDMLNRLALFNHRRTVHGDLMGREIICETCGKNFSHKARLDEHMKNVHIDVRPFICDTCGKSFKTNGSLKDHMTRTHTEDGRLKYNEKTREKTRRRKLVASQLASKTGGGG